MTDVFYTPTMCIQFILYCLVTCKYTVVRSLLFRFKIRIFLRPHSTKNVEKSNSVDWKVLSILLNLSYVGGPAYTHITSFMQQCYKCFLGARMLRLRKDVYSYIKCSFNSILPYSYFLVTVRSNFLLNSNVQKTPLKKSQQNIGHLLTIVNRLEWLWNLSDSFVICFCGPDRAQRSVAFLAFWSC